MILSTVAAASALTNTAAISHADQFDPNAGNNTASVTVSPSQADLAITKTVNNASPNVGELVDFMIIVNDLGPNTATNVTVIDLVPAGLTFEFATPSQGIYNASTGLWSVGTVTTAAVQTLRITARVDTPAALTNTATIIHADQFDPNVANNAASVTISPAGADLSITKTVSNATPNVGDTVTFTISVADFGPGTGTNVVATDVLPPGLGFVTATPSQGSYNAATRKWAIGTVTTAATNARDPSGRLTRAR